jgi:tRNA threonylcarbamoyladenosine biosynthesis protein TsaB
MISLLLDTATNFGVIALCKEGKVLCKKEFTQALTNSQLLLPSVASLFQEAKLEAKDLSYIACGKGPGSYTGIRVSVAFAKGVSFALGIPLVGVSSLRGFIPTEGLKGTLEFRGTFLAAIDAKIGGVYVAEGYVTDQGVCFSGEDVLVTPAEFEEMQRKADVIITPQKSPLEKRFAGISQKIEERAPSLSQLATLAHEAYRAHNFSEDGSLEIAYLRKTQAEIECS